MGTLLEEVIDLEKSGEQALTYLRVTAQRAGVMGMAEWLSHELRGYPSREKVPEYRRWQGRLQGTIQAGGAYILTEQDVTELLPPEKIMESTEYVCMEPFGVLERRLPETKDDMVRAQMLGEVLATLNAGAGRMRLQNFGVCTKAELVFGSGQLEQVVRHVRQNAIDFCLKCEAEGVELPHPMEGSTESGPFWTAERQEIVGKVWQILKEVAITGKSIAEMFE